jgi:gliding motility-associated-like protein
MEFQVQGSIFTRDSLGIAPDYSWDFGDPASALNHSAAPAPRHDYGVPRGYTAHLDVTTIYGCQVHVPVPVAVPKPFVMKVVPSRDTTICKGSQASLHASGAYRYVWSPADGLSDVNSDSPTAAPATATTYRVIGYARGNCQIDTAYTRVGVQELPRAAISTPDTLVCPGAPIHWLNTSTGEELSYQWHFGDGTASAQHTPAKDYIASGIYTVSLNVTSKVGCRDSVVKENYIRVGEPHARWNYADSNASCVPLVVSIKNLSENYRKIHWDFGDGTSSEDTSAVRHSYGVPGSYRLRMLVYGFSRDCMDSIVKTVVVKGPYGFPKIADSIGCSPFPAQFSAAATNTVSYQWDFGDGTSSDASPSDAAAHTYPHGGIFQPVVELTDPRGCRLAIPTPHRVQVDEIHVTPSASFPEVCDSSIRGFQVEETIFTKDSLDLPVTYQWDFGEPAYAGNSSTGGTPRHDYHAAGQYATQLTVETSYGCTATVPLAVSVPEPYVMRVTSSADTTVCKGNPVTLHAGGAARYVWSPAEGLSAVEGASTIAVPGSTITYQVIGYSVGDCQSDTARVQIIVKNQPVITLPADTTVGTGSTFMLPVSYSLDAITWSWTPSQYLDCANCATPVTTPHSPIAYRVVTSNQWGCSDTASVNIHLICKEGKVFIPNTFTPNGDGMNDIFYPRGKGVSQVLEFLIYNRWGQLMYSRSYFQLNDKSAGWNGTFKGQKLAPGVFVYQTLMRCESGNIFKLNGNVTLLR